MPLKSKLYLNSTGAKLHFNDIAYCSIRDYLRRRFNIRASQTWKDIKRIGFFGICLATKISIADINRIHLSSELRNADRI